MHKKQLSSNFTIILKIVLPGIYLLAITGAIIGLTLSGQYGGALAAFISLLIFGPLIYLGLIRLKKVSIDSNHIYISNYVKTIKIPISGLKDIGETSLLNYHPIWITFRTKTPFGKVIMFMPSTDVTAIFSTHPITKELKELIR